MMSLLRLQIVSTRSRKLRLIGVQLIAITVLLIWLLLDLRTITHEVFPALCVSLLAYVMLAKAGSNSPTHT